jgi:hypothetical protein
MKLYSYRERNKRKTTVCWNEDFKAGAAVKTKRRAKHFSVTHM